MALGVGCGSSADTACVAGAAFPAPRFTKNDGITATVPNACVDTTDLALVPSTQTTLDDAIARLLSQNGLSAHGGARCAWTITFTGDALPLDADATRAWSAAPASGRWAAETVVVGPTEAATTVRADDASTALNALRVLLASGSAVAEGTIVDGPNFASRGIIEGSYGSPWSVDDRATTIALLGRLRGNVYVYAPKEDPFANERWADLYPADRLEAIARAAAQAKRDLVDFYWAVSPGWRTGPPISSIQYGNEDDFTRLTAKLSQLRAAGVDHFALFLDDIRPDFAWPADATIFGSLAAAHALLANRLEAIVASSDTTDLWFVGTHYFFDEDWLDYNTTLGNSLDPRVTVLWTGPSVYSKTITASDLAPIDLALRRNVAVWDNAPSHVLPLGGRASDLASAASGYLANTVFRESGQRLEDYLAILGTVADYDWDTERYEPTTSIAQWARVRTCLVLQSREK
ncbi:MAG: beta-N-acetylglucosaminidase [Myxococcales bacterium]|nr:beta-N-acetylglucosaminidase [Myxococcales bacterium]